MYLVILICISLAICPKNLSKIPSKLLLEFLMNFDQSYHRFMKLFQNYPRIPLLSASLAKVWFPILLRFISVIFNISGQKFAGKQMETESFTDSYRNISRNFNYNIILLKKTDNYHAFSDFCINWFELFFIFGIFDFCHKFFIPKW